MQVKCAADYSMAYSDSVDDVFTLLTLPRREYAALGETGFFDVASSHQFSKFLLSQIETNIRYIIKEYFEEKAEALERPVSDALGRPQEDDGELSVTFYYHGYNYPVGIRVRTEFDEGKTIATTTRMGHGEESLSKVDMKNFDRLYGEFKLNQTDRFEESISVSATLSIRNTQEFVDYSVKTTDYDRSVQDWQTEESLLSQVF